MALRTEVTLMAFTLAVSLIGICYWQYRRRRKAYVKVGKVKRLFFFPVKSLKGIEVNEINCGSRGIQCFGMQERCIMLITDKGVLISLREEPSLVLLTHEINGDKLIIHSNDSDPLVINWKHSISGKERTWDCKLHRDIVKAVDLGDEAAKWFNKYLKRSDVRLVQYSAKLPDRKFTGNEPIQAQVKIDYPVNLQDLSAFHVVSQSSLDKFNSMLDKEISIHNFRPNILIEGSPPFDEDNWESLKFPSGVEMCSMLPCGRCLLTTVDPETGIKTNKEPLVTLRKFRMSKNPEVAKSIQHSPCFGINSWCRLPGKIHVGDDVFAVIHKGLFEFK